MRKLSLALAFLLMLVLAGCSVRPYDAMRAALDKTSALESAEYDFTTSLSLQAGEYEDTVTSEGILRRAGGQESPICAVTLTANGVKSSLYYADGVLYTAANGQKLRTQPDDETLGQILNAGTMLDIAETDFLELEYAEANSAVVRGVVSSERLPELLGDALDGLGLDQSSFEWSDVTVEIEIQDGYAVRQTMQYSLSAELDGIEGVIEVINEIRCDDPGEAVEVEAPGDLDAYAAG